MTTLGGKVEGITSDEVSRLTAEVARLRQEALSAIIDFYASDDAEVQKGADERARDAYRKASSAENRRDGLQEIQADAQFSRQQIADWAKLI